MKRTIRLRAQEPEAPERKVRLRLPGRLASELDEYRELYAEVHGHEIDLPALVEGMLEQFLASDRFFQRRRRGSAPSAQRQQLQPQPGSQER
jgi:hypothetical protein